MNDEATPEPMTPRALQASVKELSGKSFPGGGGYRNIRIRMLLAGAENILPTSSVMMAMCLTPSSDVVILRKCALWWICLLVEGLVG